MARTKLGNQYSVPEIDWLKALVMERADALGYNHKTLAEKTGIEYATFRRMMRTSPWDWKPERRKSVCRTLGITKEMMRRTEDF